MYLFMFFKKHILLIIVLPLAILFIGASYTRFVINQDYLVSYEGDCDPAASESCFVYCEDEECTDPFYYSIIERRASVVHELCGEDVSICDEAYWCSEDESECSITFCDPQTDGECITAENTNELTI